MQALVSLATNASFGFSYTNFAKLRIPFFWRDSFKQILKALATML